MGPFNAWADAWPLQTTGRANMRKADTTNDCETVRDIHERATPPTMRDLIPRLLRGFLKRRATSSDIDGLWVGASDEELLPKMRNALQLIASHDPVRYARLRKDVRGVWVTQLPGPYGQFEQSDFTCELDDRFVTNSSLEKIASVIVHEATHARLWRRGFGYSENIRQRVEAICLRREVAFASRLPDSGTMPEELSAMLDLPPSSWSDETMAKSHLRGLLEMMKHAELPRWLIVRFLRFGRWAQKRRRSLAKTAHRGAPPERVP